jgi:hypothetical protein
MSTMKEVGTAVLKHLDIGRPFCKEAAIQAKQEEGTNG